MATAETLTTPSAALDDPAARRMRRRAIIASAAGTTIEWYDFFLYGVAAALVFPRQFFPGNDPYIGTLLAFSTYFVGFVARPFGAALFGHYGDRIGRKTALIATLVLMGAATIGIGLVPELRQHRHLGRGAADVLPRHPGHRRRRRVGRRGADGRRVDRPEAARLHHQLRPARRPGRHGAGQRRAVGDVVRDQRRSVSELGLARAVPAQRRAGVRRPLHPHRRARDAGVRQAAGAGPGREGAGRRRS